MSEKPTPRKPAIPGDYDHMPTGRRVPPPRIVIPDDKIDRMPTGGPTGWGLAVFLMGMLAGMHLFWK